MNLKIVNFKKFITSILLLFGLITLACLLFSNKSYSKAKEAYKKETIVLGDTLWTIAQNEQTNNEYYKNKDIRYIVYDIEKLNDISNCNLKEGQEILIPIFE